MPTSTYGASKLAGEALLASYAYMFGPHRPRLPLRQRRRAAARPTASASTSSAGCSTTRPGCDILGDGKQSKSYIHVDDVIAAVLLAGRAADTPFDAFNVATGDYITVTEIAELAVEVRRARARARSTFEYTGGDRGWKGDVPIVRIGTDKIRALGWGNELTGRRGAARARCRRWPTTPAPGASTA